MAMSSQQLMQRVKDNRNKYDAENSSSSEGSGILDPNTIDVTASGKEIAAALMKQGVSQDIAYNIGQSVAGGMSTPEQAFQKYGLSSGGSGGTGSSSDSNFGMQTQPGADDYAKRQWEAEQKYRPQSAKLESELYAQYAPFYAAEQKKIIQDLYPNQSALGELMSADLKRRIEQDDFTVPDSVKNEYTRATRGAQSDRGLFRSGMAVAEESEGLARLGLQQREADLGRAERLNAGVPQVQPMNNIPGQTPQVNDYYTAILGANIQQQQVNNQSKQNEYENLNSFRNWQDNLGKGEANNNQAIQDLQDKIDKNLGYNDQFKSGGLGYSDQLNRSATKARNVKISKWQKQLDDMKGGSNGYF